MKLVHIETLAMNDDQIPTNVAQKIFFCWMTWLIKYLGSDANPTQINIGEPI